MKQFFWRGTTLILMVVLAIGVMGQQAAYAELSEPTCNPMTTGTRNSVFTFETIWTDGEDLWPDGSNVPVGAPGIVWLMGVGGGDANFPGIPMFYVEGIPRFGALYRTYVSPGLNMINQIQWPNCPKIDPQPGDSPYEFLPAAPDPAVPNSYWPQPDLAKYPNSFGYPNTLLYGPTVGGLKRPIWYAPGLPPPNNVWVMTTTYTPRDRKSVV